MVNIPAVLFLLCSPPCFHLRQAGAKISGVKKEREEKKEVRSAAKSALCTNCIFKTWCIDPRNSHVSVILHSIYNMLQLGNPQHIFSWHKRRMEIMEETGQDSERWSCSDWALTLCFETHQRKSGFWRKNLNVTSFTPFTLPPISLEGKKMCILRSIIPKQSMC